MSENITLGCSFSPEYCEQIGIVDPLKSLKFIYSKLHIKDIRFGLRWNRVDDGNELSLSYYKKYLDYLLSKEINVCLNIGPIKVFRWPEDHIPSYLDDYATSNIDEYSEISKRSLIYLESLLDLLKEEYGKKLEKETFQIENEAFNRFGELKVKISPEHVYLAIKVLNEKFPNNRLMINSAGRTNLRAILNVFDRIHGEGMYDYKSLILGINYYYKLPHTQPFFNVIDTMKISYPFDMSLKQLHRRCLKDGFHIEISEGQFEPWGSQKDPGNTFNDYKYLLEKSSEILNVNPKEKVLRLWGVEEFSQKFLKKEESDEHLGILRSIANNRSMELNA